ncbi:sulfate transporter CysZ [Dasania sp. GY-MA-18]|uniref:Sulfate transporter CysZ n=1 Tax=Dasania phycosphaerae TaxID=2950436 RepID=A0A9J6RHR5_9GAMM|nr:MULTISPECIES: sulfate transporter CysZ [Dasania]MCR8921478.1 sulfate transporter CysZ [Dasania sp. GY-MA-18]MCZ0863906.1 sulfate transporter CysZ [Dasania phycosphaerae]MCZ0867634.1 sulfate transporter CysZ [Dasania phycosphaerae]
MRGNLIHGAEYLAKGFQLITQPGLRLFVIIPLLINIAIFALLLTLTFQQFAQWIDDLMAWLPSWLEFLRWVVWPLTVIFVLAISSYLFSTIANLIASPFNGLLAEKVEERLTGEPVNGPETLAQLLIMVPKSFARELQKILYYLPWALLALVITFIPVVNIISPVLWFLLGSWMMSIQYCDLPMDNNQHSFKAMKTVLGQHRLTSSGFGMIVMAGTMIPLVNFVIMPAAVCGATVYWVEKLKQSPSLQQH